MGEGSEQLEQPVDGVPSAHEPRCELQTGRVADDEARWEGDQRGRDCVGPLTPPGHRRYYGLSDFPQDGCLLTDQRGVILDANQAAVEMFQTRKEFLVGKPFPLFVAEGERQQCYRMLARSRNAPVLLHDWPVRVRPRRNVSPLLLSVTVTPQAGEDEGRGVLRWLLRDMTGAAWAQQALQAERAFADSLVDLAQAIVLVLDSRARVLRCNPYSREVTGRTDADLLGCEWGTLLPPEDRHLAWEVVWEALSHGVSRKFTGGLLTKEGQPRTVAWSVRGLHHAGGAKRTTVPLTLSGGPTVLVLGHDITELKEVERQALQAERLAAIGQVTTALAHESRNLLQASQSCLERLSWRLVDKPEALDLVARVQQAQLGLTRLFEDVRTYAAPLRLDYGACRLDEVWREAWEQARRAVRAKEGLLHEDVQGVDPWCSVDRFRLGQVFRNVLENALAAALGPAPARIDIVCRPADVAGRQTVRVTIRDDGPGLDAEARRRIFEPFYTTKPRGCGLGMAIARRIVEAHGGQITVGHHGPPGAEIILLLPRGQP